MHLSRKKEHLHTALLYVFITSKEIFIKLYPNLPEPELICTFRDGQMQNELYKKGRSLGGYIITNATFGQSPHNYLPSLAFDIGFFSVNNRLIIDESLYFKFSRIALSLDVPLRCGVDFKTINDPAHFEIKNYYTFAEQYQIKKVFNYATRDIANFNRKP